MKLNKEFIEKVSKSKGEPEWMLEFRLKSFEKFLELDNPSFFKSSSNLIFLNSWDNYNTYNVKHKDFKLKFLIFLCFLLL